MAIDYGDDPGPDEKGRKMKKFKVTYLDSEGTLQIKEAEFTDTEKVTALEWAQDWAYTLADKGSYELAEEQTFFGPHLNRGTTA